MFVGLVTFLTVGASGQIKKGKTRAITTKQLMVGLVKPQCGGLGESLKSAPTDDKMWGELAIKAALLNEISYNSTEYGRCPDKDWAVAVTGLRDGSEAVLAKIEAKDHSGAQEAFKAITASCAACHKVHKK